MFSVASWVIKNIPALSVYAQDLSNRAEAAWARSKITTSNFTVYDLNCDDGDIKSGDADADAAEQLDRAFVASVYLYALTNKSEYKTFGETNYTNVNPYKINWWGPYWIPQQLALLRFASLTGVSSTVANNIRNQKAGMNYLFSINDYNSATDLYRSYLADAQYHWGHNQVHANAGSQNLDFNTFNINSTNQSLYKEVAEQYLHWLHGVNPLGMVMLTNMYAYGGEQCANEIYHTWFTDGSIWDNALTSPNGPAPGYVPGGPNKSYSGSVTTIANQPPQKAYKDWNTSSETSWEITEPAIYSQAAYIMLLSRLMQATVSNPDTTKPTAPINLTVTNTSNQSISISWNASTDNIGVTAYEIYQNNVLVNGALTTTTYTASNLNCNTGYSFYVKAKDAAGNVSTASNTVNSTTTACNVTVNKMIYDESLHSEWTNVSSSPIIFNNTTPVHNGAFSIRTNYGSNGTMAFSKTTALTTTTTTQLRFWVYNTGNNSIKVFTQSQDNGGNSTLMITKPPRKSWIEIVINLSQLGNPTTIKRVTIQNSSTSSTTMYFDNVQLTNVIETAPLVSLHPASFSMHTSSHLDVFPNPAMNKIHLKYMSDSREEVYKIQLVDVHGKLLYSSILNKKDTYPMIDLSAFMNGPYFIRLWDGGEWLSKKIIIAK